jgi:nucleotide-binding universal stress UspA family protein
MSTNVAIKKILVPVDGSKPSERAAEYAVDIAAKRGATIVTVHVMHLPAYAFTPSPIEGMPTPAMAPIPLTVSSEERKIVESYLHKVKEMARKAGVTAEAKIIEDQPSIVHAITETAQKEACDLIVIGTKGRTGIRKILLGSVASGVVTYSSCPVLVVR